MANVLGCASVGVATRSGTVIPHSAAKLFMCRYILGGVGDLLSLVAGKQIPRAKGARGMTVSRGVFDELS